MKRLLILALLLAPVAAADVTTTATFTDQQAARITRAMKRTNTETCAHFGLPAACTTLQARAVFCQRANLTGTDCAGATQFLIYPTIDAYLKREMLKMVNETFTAADAAEDKAAAAAAWAAKTQAQRDAICATLGLPAGCTAF